jgi:hypothetical protein
MSGFKDIADVADHLIYEVIALLLPGALLGLLFIGVLGPDVAGINAWRDALNFVSSHEVIAAAISYSFGYVVQGLSRPVTHRLDAVLKWLGRSVNRPRIWLLREVLSGRGWVERKVLRWPESLPPKSNAADNKSSINLEELMSKRLAQRLGLDEVHSLTSRDVQDLAFSALLPEVKRLERFRAAASCVRGLATVLAIGWLTLVVELAVGLVSRDGWPLTWWSIGALAAMTAAFEALLSRERMYEATWRSIIAPQFLIATTEAPLKSRPET